MYFFFLFWSPMLFFFSLQYLIKGAFVSPEKHFKKSFYTLPCVWLRMKNLVKRKIIFVDCKITHFSHKINYTLILPSNDFQDLQTERERRKSTGVRNPSPLSSTPRTNEREMQLHPTRRRRFEVPHTPTSSAAIPNPLNLTSTHFELYMYSIHQGKTLPHADETHLTFNISNPSLPHRQRNTSLKPTIYNTQSTSLQTHLPFLLFSHSTSPPRSRRRDHCPWPTHDQSLSFSIYLSLSPNFWSLSLPPSLSLIELFEFGEWFCFDFCFFKFIYWNFQL